MNRHFKIARGGRSARPRVEPLEDRTVPAGIVAAGSPAGSPPAVEVYDADTKELLQTLHPFADSFTGGVNVAVGEVTGDGVADVIVAAGPGGGPHVRVYDGVTGEPLPGVLGGFFAYDPSFTGGVNVAVGDVNADGYADVITAAGPGGGPHVKAFSGFDGSLIRNFFAYAPSFTGGVAVTAADFTGDGHADIVTGAGPGGGPHVNVFDGVTGGTVHSFFAYDPGFRGGVNVAAGEFDGGGTDLVTGTGPGGGPHVKAFRGTDFTEAASYFPLDPASRNGVAVAAGESSESREFSQFYYTPAAAGGPLAVDDGPDAGEPVRLAALMPASPLTAAAQRGDRLAASDNTVVLEKVGLATYFSGTPDGLPRTKVGAGSKDANQWETTEVATPNVTAGVGGLPPQTNDWWSSVIARTASNDPPLYMNADPVVVGWRSDQTLTNTPATRQFALGQNLSPRPEPESHYEVGNFAPTATSLKNNAGRVYYSFQNATSNNARLDLQVGVFDPNDGKGGPGNTITNDGSVSPVQRAVPAADLAVDDYSDWGATFSWTNGSADSATRLRMTATAMTGNPFTYFRKSAAGGAEIYLGKQFTVSPPPAGLPNSNGVNFLASRIVLQDTAAGVILLAVPQVNAQQFYSGEAYYAIFLPAGSAQTVKTGTSPPGIEGKTIDFPAAIESDLAGKDYFSVAVLPQAILSKPGGGAADVDRALLETYRSHAYAFPKDAVPGQTGSTEVTPTFDPSTGRLTTEYRVYTELLEPGVPGDPARTNVNAPLFLLFPNQYGKLDAASASALAATDAKFPDLADGVAGSARGPQRLYVPVPQAAADGRPGYGGFRTELLYRGGILPGLPSGITSDADNATLLAYLKRVAATPFDRNDLDKTAPAGTGNFDSLTNTYFGGKDLQRLANLLPLFDEVRPTATTTAADIAALRDKLLGEVKRQLANWFDATDYQFFLYDEVWHSMIGFPSDFGSKDFNDHHFHYGYFLKAAALVARYDPSFVSDAQFGPMLTLLAKDVANWDRTDQRFPFLRNFQPYLGFSYADGYARGELQNNQESSSEAMNFASGLVLLGEAMMGVNAALGRQLRDTGIYLFTTEENSVGEYWFDANHTNFPADFTSTFDSTSLVAPIDATQTTIRVQVDVPTVPDPNQPGNVVMKPIRLPAITPFVVQLNGELMLVTGRADGGPVGIQGGKFTVNTDTWTVVRGYLGTTPDLHWPGNNPAADAFTKVQATALRVSVKSPLFRNSTLTAGIDAATDTLTVASTAAFPAGTGFLVSVGDEVMKVVGRPDGTTLKVQRGQSGTGVAAHAAGVRVRLVSPTPTAAATVVRGPQVVFGNLFAGDDTFTSSSNYSISWLPVTASSLYLGRYRTPDGSLYADEAYKSMLWDETYLYVDDPNDPIYRAPPYYGAGPDGPAGAPGQGGKYPASVWSYQAFSDPAGALAALKKYVLTDSQIAAVTADPLAPAKSDVLTGTFDRTDIDRLDSGESVPFAFAFISSLAKFGEVDPTVSAVAAAGSDLPATYGAFRNRASGVVTYVGYNSSPTQARRITFKGGPDGDVTLDLPPLALVYQTGTDAGSRTVVAPRPTAVTPAPDNRFFLRADNTLSRDPGAVENPITLPVYYGSDGRGGQSRGPDYYLVPESVRVTDVANFELHGVSGKAMSTGSSPTDPRTQFGVWVKNNLSAYPLDPDTFSAENGAQVIVNVAYFRNEADAAAHTPFRVEVYNQGPINYNGNRSLASGFVTGLWAWEEYQSVTWFTGNNNDPTNPAGFKDFVLGQYEDMTNGVVRMSVWTFNPNFRLGGDGGPNKELSNIGLRVGAAANQGRQSFLDIPYTGVTVSGG